MKQRAVVLAGDYKYIDQILTTIKSICYHNRQMKIYLIHHDIPKEWFRQVNQVLKSLDCELVNAKLNHHDLIGYKTAIHYSVFFRYFAAEVVAEDRVLYLDSDMVVTGDLTPLFTLDMQGYPLAAVKDLGAWVYREEYVFNAGMQLIDVAIWKSQKIKDQLIQLTTELHEEVSDADQSILNLFFKDRWLELDNTYNHVGIHAMFLPKEQKTFSVYPRVIHYLTSRKPWSIFSMCPYREEWWFYHDLSWSAFPLTPVTELSPERIKKRYKYSALIFTNSAAIPHLDYLIMTLPQVQFRVASVDVFAPNLELLGKYDNVELNAGLLGVNGFIQDLIDTSDCLLDINLGDEAHDVVSQFQEKGKPILAFDETKHGERGQQIFSIEEPKRLAETLKSLYDEKVSQIEGEEKKDYLTLVLAGDYGYVRQIETTIKSVCYHLGDKPVTFYILNQNIPAEWFDRTRKRLKQLSCELIDSKLFDSQFQTGWKSSYWHINYMAYARYFIPRIVAEDRVLYLDSDLVVTSSLDDLIEMDMQGYALAAAKATYGLGFGLNSGVLLIDNAKWRQERIMEQLVDLTNEHHESITEGDQEIFNMLFKQNYLVLPDRENFQIGFDQGASLAGHGWIFEMPLDPLPRILHYISPDKPWNTFSSGRLREVWWFYDGLEWEDIFKKQAEKYQVIAPRTVKANFFLLTNTVEIAHLDYLVQAFSDCQFHIAAYTDMGWDLLKMNVYENVTLYPRVLWEKVQKLFSECDAYLDISYDSAFPDFSQATVSREEKMILAFTSTTSLPEHSIIVDDEHPEEMVGFLKNLLDRREHGKN